MFRRRKLLRKIAIFLAVNSLLQVIFPVVSYALTSGPTAPEYTSFEPVDTSDMVNLATGDFTYNIPLLEVPGPEGGYPLSLSYHAGIKPNQEASWVGLGWTLNTGAVNRMVNGYPDDYLGAHRSVRDYWEGGERHAYSLGVGLGAASAGLTVANDTYQGVGVGMSAGYGFKISEQLGVGFKAGTGPYGGAYAGGGLNVGNFEGKAQGLSGNIGISTNFQSVSFNGGLGYNSLGASISSTSLKPSFGVAGASASTVNSKAGAITTESHNFFMPIPVGNVIISVGYQYLRYYSDERSEVNSYGVLHANSSWQDPDNNALDSYALLDPNLPGGIVDNPEVDKILGGSFLAYDNYQVLGQGIGGTIQPYNFRNGTVYRQNVQEKNSDGDLIEGKYHVEYKKAQIFGEINFRFKNDFSNALTFEEEMGFDFARYTYNGVDFTDDNSQPATSEGYGEGNHLAGSKHIEYFTNEQIDNGTAYDRYGFINHERDPSTVNGAAIAEQIGGFMITNESGVTYHYALPVYSYEEESYHWHYDIQEKLISRKIYNHEPYAYTWLLTAITGPDFVDRGVPGGLDQEDWGYWVEFDYGLWTDNYKWRNPAVGEHIDIDGKVKFYSNGKKELYYLDAVRTRSHTALFVKEIRPDGKGLTVANQEESSFKSTYPPINCEYVQMPASSSLKLTNILLLDNSKFNYENLKDLKASSSIYDDNSTFTCNHPGTGSEGSSFEVEMVFHKGKNVLDKYDVEGLNLREKAIREIELETDYSLAPETTNSFYTALDVDGTEGTENEDLLLGKLSLKKVHFLGKTGKSVLPPLAFNYDLEQPRSGTVTSFTSEAINVSDHNFQLGDIIKFETGDLDYYVLLEGEDSAYPNSFYVNYLGVNQPASGNGIGGSFSAVQTKNPPFNKDFYDEWQMYKSDYVDMENKNLSRLVSDISSKSKDVWSLRGIEAPLGAKISIDYSPDHYSESAFYIDNTLNIKNIILEGYPSGEFKINFIEDVKPKEIFKQGDVVNVLCNMRFVSDIYIDKFIYNSRLEDRFYLFENLYEPVVVKEVFEDGIIVEGTEAFDKLTEIKGIIPKTVYTRDGKLVTINFNFPRFPYVTGGNIFFPQKAQYNGGDLKVSKILSQINSKKSSVLYDYEKGNVPYPPKGLNNYNLDSDNISEGFKADKDEILKEFKKKLYTKFSDLLANSRELPSPTVIYEMVTVSQEVEQNGKRLKVPGKKVYRFQGFDQDMIDFKKSDRYAERGTHTFYKQVPVTVPCDEINPGQPGDCTIYEDQVDKTVETEKRRINIRDYTSRIGNLISITTYDGNNMIHRLTNKYLHDEDGDNNRYDQALASRFQNQGLVSQVNHEYKVVKDQDDVYRYKAMLSRKEEYPSVHVKSIEEDFNTGIKRVSENLAFDFYTGQATQVLTSDGYGNNFVSIKEPAYQLQYDGEKVYSNMGLKTAVSARYGARKHQKHMLTQGGASYALKVNDAYRNNPVDANVLGIVAASTQTWDDEWAYREFTDGSFAEGSPDTENKVWRKKGSFSYQSDLLSADNATGDYSEFAANQFNWADPSQNSAHWLESARVTLYNRHSKALEAKDLNNVYAATKVGYNESRIIATASASRYHEMTYSGAEDEPLELGSKLYFSGEVGLESGYRTAEVSHTGDYSLMVEQGNKGFVYLANGLSDKGYFSSVWVHKTNAVDAVLYAKTSSSEQRADLTTATKAGDWYLLQLNIPASMAQDANLEIGCKNVAASASKVFVDDFRFHPLESSFSSYVYDQQTGELTFVLDNQNFFTRYYYNADGKLAKVAHEVIDKGTIAGGERLSSEFFINYASKPINEDLTAEFDVQGELKAATPLTFITKGTGLQNGSATYTWDFGDGTTLVGAGEVKHSYNAGGTYTINCTATFQDNTATFSKIVVIEESQVQASYTESGYKYTGHSLTFAAAANTLPGTTTYHWDYGTGTFVSGEQTVNKTFNTANTYKVRLKVVNSIYGTSNIFEKDIIIEQAPVVSSDFNVVGLQNPGEQLGFNRVSQDLPGGENTYYWNLGDGTLESGSSITHSYEAPGTYTVTLTVTNSDFGSSSTEKTVEIIDALASTVSLCIDGSVYRDECNGMNMMGNCTEPETPADANPIVKLESYDLGGCESYSYIWYQNKNDQGWTYFTHGNPTHTVSFDFEPSTDFKVYCEVTDACGKKVTSSTIGVKYVSADDCN